ncbi:nucleotidyltransferase family protein [Paenibacillus sp.]|uniref:nucleotidyltransferase family protein n=1 Tax=Paenibacillus sp. TaxID=58172 RepID=UPI002D23AADC|nr:nucleotidyltransferase family protein [Paenibacillus sp.]HZG88382.1 nucleotidyltransferase family protein [Paenibacillus sp.]
MEEKYRVPLIRYTRNGGRIDYETADDESKALIREVGARNLFIRHRLAELLRRLTEVGIRSVVLKGAHLIQTAYPFGLRPVDDIDLLVDIADFPRLATVLRDMGYEAFDVGIDQWTHLHISNKITYSTRSAPVVPIDVHFSLGPYPYLGSLTSDVVFANTETITMENGQTMTVLRPELLLTHLALHLFQHHFENWQVSACDIAALLRQKGDAFDWQAFGSIADRHRLRLPIAYALRKASELAGIDIPEEWGKRDVKAGAFETWVFRTSSAQRTGFDRFFIQFVTTPGLALKWKAASQIVRPSRMFLDLHYGGSYFKYAVSAIKIAVKGLTAMGKKNR